MIELGKMQPLMVVKKTEFGVYLGTKDENVLLPSKYAEDLEIGDSVEVFVYKDSKDRLIATTKRPFIELGKLARLGVKDVTDIGAFLDWGLEKDLFLPFKEQTCKVRKGRSYLVRLYIDKSSRLSASMKIYHELETFPDYKAGDEVTGFAYEHIDKFGMFIAVDGKYQGLIPAREYYGDVEVGDEITATIAEVTADGKLRLRTRKDAYLQLDEDGENILRRLNEGGGALPYGDSSDPDEIRDHFGMSKAAFKRACGRLMKQGKITIAPDKISLK